MKNIVLSIILANTLLLASDIDLTNKKIADTKAQIEALQANLKQLESSLPVQKEKEEAMKLAAQKKANELKTHAEFGFISTSGNTDTTTYNLDLKMKKAWNKHSLEFSFDSQYADDNGIETKNKYLGELEYDYALTSRFAFDYLIGYKRDKFSSYNYQMYTGPGMKYQVIQEEKHNLSLEGNILYAEDELQDTLVKNRYSSFRTKGIYEWQILENLKFTQDLSYRTEIEDIPNYFVFSKTAFSSKLSDIFSFGISYKIDYTNKVPTSTHHSDKTLTANLIADY